MEKNISNNKEQQRERKKPGIRQYIYAAIAVFLLYCLSSGQGIGLY